MCVNGCRTVATLNVYQVIEDRVKTRKLHFLLMDRCVCLSVLRSDEDICKLYCIAEDYDFFFAMSGKVKDGTSCSEHKGDICIDGVCEVHRLHGSPVLLSETFTSRHPRLRLSADTKEGSDISV